MTARRPDWEARVERRLDRAAELLGNAGDAAVPLADAIAAAASAFAALVDVAAQALKLAEDDR